MTIIYYIGLTKDDKFFINEFRENIKDFEMKLKFTKETLIDFECLVDPSTTADLNRFIESSDCLLKTVKDILKQIKTDEIKVKNDEN